MNHAYTAGLIDGEGTIGISYKHSGCPFRAPYVSVSSTTPQILEYLQRNYGGSISKQKTYKAHHKPAWSWTLTKLDQIQALLTSTLPFMLEPEKIRRANLLLSTYSSVTLRNGKYNPSQRAAKIRFETDFLGV